MDIKDFIKDFVIALLVSACLYMFGMIQTYKVQISLLNKELDSANNIIADELVVNSTSATSAVYIDKIDKNDNDVELNANNNIKVKVNSTTVSLPNNVKETQKFENGKLIIEQKTDNTVDLTKIVNDLADAKGKQYSRSGKVDLGIIYNRKESELYGGMQYNAKAWNVGYYHSLNKSNDLIMFNYKL